MRKLPDPEDAQVKPAAGGNGIGAENYISNEMLLAIVKQSDDMILVRSVDGLVLYCNAATERVLGYKPSELIGENIWKTYPQDRHVEFEHLADRFRKGEALEDFETVRRCKDGREIFASITLYPLRDSNGEIYAVAGITRDITARKRAYDIQKLVVQELQHRVKNTLSVVRSLLTQTARQSSDLEDFLIGFKGRLDAMARVQGLMSRTVASIADFEEMVSEELLAHGARLGENVSVEGPDVSLSRGAAATIGLVLHELASNSVKYGALADEDGSIAVTWSVAEGDPSPVMEIAWVETGLDTVPDKKFGGFGRLLIERAVPYQLNGEASLVFEDDALRCRLKFPLEQQRSDLEKYGLSE